MFVYVYGSRSFAHLNTTQQQQYWVDAAVAEPQAFDMHDNKTCNLVSSLYSYTRNDDALAEERPRLHSGIIICEMSVMIMPMLLFRYFGTCVNSCRIILHTAISTRGKTIETVWVDGLALHHIHHISCSTILVLAIQKMLLFDKNYENFPVFGQISLLVTVQLSPSL